MLCLLVLLIWRLIYIWIPGRCVKFNQADLICRTKQPIRSREILRNQWEKFSALVISWNPVVVGISKKRRLSQKSKVSTVHIEIRRLGLRVSQTKVPSFVCTNFTFIFRAIYFGAYDTAKMMVDKPTIFTKFAIAQVTLNSKN